jgi:anti-anti-sigma factor
MVKPEMFDTEDEGQALIVIPLRSAQDLWEREENIQSETDCLLEHVGDPPARDVVIDLTHVPYFRSDSNLLRALVAIWRHLKANGRTMTLCNVSAIGHTILEATQFNTLWPVYSTRNEALQKICA